MFISNNIDNLRIFPNITLLYYKLYFFKSVNYSLLKLLVPYIYNSLTVNFCQSTYLCNVSKQLNNNFFENSEHILALSKQSKMSQRFLETVMPANSGSKEKKSTKNTEQRQSQMQLYYVAVIFKNYLNTQNSHKDTILKVETKSYLNLVKLVDIFPTGWSIIAPLICKQNYIHACRNNYNYVYFSKNFSRTENKSISNDIILSTGGEENLYLDLLLRYTEHMFGSKVALNVIKNPSVYLRAEDLFYIQILKNRAAFWLVKQAPRNWTFVTTTIICAFKQRDANLLTSWVHARVKYMNLFMHNKFFTFFFFFLKTALNATQAKYNIVGLKFRLAGKISGVGNARKRTMTLKHGKINLNNMQLQTSHAFYLVRTTSGCLGLSMFLFFKR